MSEPTVLHRKEPVTVGTVVVVVQVAPDGSPRQASGSVAAIQGPDFALEIDPTPWRAGDEGMFVALPGGDRFRNTGEVVAVQAESVLWRPRSTWQWWGDERRSDTRFPCNIGAEMAQEGGRGYPCTIVDISRGGAAITSRVPLRTAASHLLVEAGGFSSWFPCELVGANAGIGHVRFQRLDRRQTALLDVILNQCQGTWDGIAASLVRA